MLILLLGIKVP